MRFKEWLLLSEKIEVNGVQFRDKLDALKYIYANHPNPDNLVVSYTSINKIGINPKSKFDTPFGIYFYPLKYVIDWELNVPFAGDQPYINVCEIVRPNKILHMQKTVEPQLGIDLLMKTFSETEVENAIARIKTKGLDIRSSYSTVWLATRLISNENPILWNTNLRKLGIDGFFDHGTGTIHTFEPTQGVVFTANALKVIHVIENKKNKEKYIPSVLDLIKNIKNKDEWAKSFIKSKKQMLSDDDISTIMGHVANQDKIAKIIIQNKKEISNDNVFYLLHYASKPQEIADILGSENINKLSNNNILLLLSLENNKQEIANILGSENINKLSNHDVYRLLFHASKPQEIADILGSENINKLSSNNVHDLLNKASDKQEMAKIIIQYKTKLSSDNVFELLLYASDKQEIANILGSEIINKLSSNDVYRSLFNASFHASNKQEMAKILGSENINKLNDNHIYNLIRYASGKQEIARIIDQYYTNKTPEIEKLIQPYLLQQSSPTSMT